MDPLWGLPELDRSDDVRMLDTGPERGFPKKPGHGGAILP